MSLRMAVAVPDLDNSKLLDKAVEEGYCKVVVDALLVVAVVHMSPVVVVLQAGRVDNQRKDQLDKADETWMVDMVASLVVVLDLVLVLALVLVLRSLS